MTVLDGERDKVTNAEQKSTQERSAAVPDGDPPAVRPLFPLANCTHHMTDFVHDLIVIGVVLCDSATKMLEPMTQVTITSHTVRQRRSSPNAVAALECPITKSSRYSARVAVVGRRDCILARIPMSSVKGHVKPLREAWFQHSVQLHN